MQAPRHPISASSNPVSGQATVLAKPAISVMPVIGARASLPYAAASAENADSYRPMDIPTPITSHATQSQARLGAQPISARPAAKTTFDATSIPRPPNLSIQRPTNGPPI